MNEVESVAHNDEGQLVSQFGLLQEVLDSFWAVAVRFAAYSLNLREAVRGGVSDQY